MYTINSYRNDLIILPFFMVTFALKTPNISYYISHDFILIALRNLVREKLREHCISLSSHPYTQPVSLKRAYIRLTGLRNFWFCSLLSLLICSLYLLEKKICFVNSLFIFNFFSFSAFCYVISIYMKPLNRIYCISIYFTLFII